MLVGDRIERSWKVKEDVTLGKENNNRRDEAELT
jgi:hypothetical protein